MTLGQQIGKFRHSLSVTNDKNEKAVITLVFDFTTATDDDIRLWLAGNRTIAFQRPARSLSVGEIKALDGSTVLATDAGKKTKSREEKIADMVRAGIPEKLAVVAVDKPDVFNDIMGKAVEATEDETTEDEIE